MQNERPSNRISRQRVRNHPLRRPSVFVKPIGAVQHTYVVRGHGLEKNKKGLTGNEDVSRATWHATWVRSPRVDDRRHRSTESCGKGHGLDPLLNNACNGRHSIGSDPNRMIRRGEDIETKWFSGRSTTPIRSKGKKTCDLV